MAMCAVEKLFYIITSHFQIHPTVIGITLGAWFSDQGVLADHRGAGHGGSGRDAVLKFGQSCKVGKRLRNPGGNYLLSTLFIFVRKGVLSRIHGGLESTNTDTTFNIQRL